MQNEPIEVTLKVTDVFEKLGVPYLIGGSLASTLYGMVRTTQDSDIVTEMRLEHLQPFIAALQNEFYIDDEMIANPSSAIPVSISSTARACSRWMFSSQVRVLFFNLNLPALRNRPLPLKLKSAPNLPAPKIRSWQNLNGIAWAAKHQNGNGVIFWAS